VHAHLVAVGLGGSGAVASRSSLATSGGAEPTPCLAEDSLENTTVGAPLPWAFVPIPAFWLATRSASRNACGQRCLQQSVQQQSYLWNSNRKLHNIELLKAAYGCPNCSNGEATEILQCFRCSALKGAGMGTASFGCSTCSQLHEPLLLLTVEQVVRIGNKVW